MISDAETYINHHTKLATVGRRYDCADQCGNRQVACRLDFHGSALPRQQNMAIGQVLRQAVGSQAEGVGLRAGAAAALRSQDHGHPVGVCPAVIRLIAIDGRHGDGLPPRGER